MSFGSDPSETSAFGLSEAWMDRIRAAIDGRYEIVRLLGRGGMAVVFLAQDVALGRRVALKVAIAGPDGDLERIRREAKLAASLEHPNIVTVHAVGDGDGLAWFAMQYVRGRTLEELLGEEERLSPERAVAILADVADALAYAHRRGVIHRDIKPANVMIGEEGRTYVTDFGIARSLGQPGITTTGMLIGSPTYMAPEQFNGDLPSASIDQYALGCLGYELLTGTVPFAGTDVASVLKGHLLSPVPSIRAARPEVPAWVSGAIERMLAKHANDRFPDLDTVRELLRSRGTEKMPVASRSGATVRRSFFASAGGFPSVLVLGGGLLSVLVLGIGLRSGGVRERDAGMPATDVPAFADSLVRPPSMASPTTAAPPGPSIGNGSLANRQVDGVRPSPPAVAAAATPSDSALDTASSEADSTRVVSAVLAVASRLPTALLYLDSQLRAVLAERNRPAMLRLAPGRYRLSVRFDGCLSWDSVIVLFPGDSINLTRTPRCSDPSFP